MTLRTRLFLIVGGLVSLLVGAEWALVTTLTEDLEDEAGSFALQVGGGVLHSLLGEDVATFTVKQDAGRLEPDGKDAGGPGGGGLRAVVFAPSVRTDGDDEPRGERVVRRIESRHVTRGLGTSGGGGNRFLRIVVDSTTVEGERSGEPGAFTVVHEGNPPVRTRLSGTWSQEPPEPRRGRPLIAIELASGPAAPPFGDPESIDFGGLFELQPLVGLEDVDMDVVLGGNGEGPWVLSSAPDILRWSHGPTRPGKVAAAPDAEVSDAGSADAEGTPSPGPIEHSVPIPRDGFQDAVAGFLRRLWLGTIAIFGIGLLVAGWVAHRVSVPLRRLSRAATEVGDGALGTQVPVDGDREVSATLAAFNRMSTRLRDLDGEARALREREHLTEIGEVARGMAHAMRNPLHLLGLSVDQLASRCGAAGPEADELAATARGQIQRVDRSLRTFLSLSSGAGGAAEPVRVDDLVRDVALELLQDGGATPVRVLADADDLAAVRAVAPELRAVLHVLVVNAVEASPPDGEVVVRVQALADGVRVAVEDEGPGLAPEVRTRLFTPHLTTKEQGAGMGLFLAHRIATSRYRGDLRLDPRAPRGTRAVLELHDRNGDLHG